MSIPKWFLAFGCILGVIALIMFLASRPTTPMWRATASAYEVFDPFEKHNVTRYRFLIDYRGSETLHEVKVYLPNNELLVYHETLEYCVYLDERAVHVPEYVTIIWHGGSAEVDVVREEP